MKNFLTTKRLCRAGVIAALYVALTFAFMPFAFGPLQLRPAEALCMLAAFYPEAIPALYIGCMISNFASPFFVYDVFLGSLATLLSAVLTYLVGRFLKKEPLRMLLCGFFPVAINALFLPLIIVFLCGGGMEFASVQIAYFSYMGMIFLTEAICVYALGAPLYFYIKRLREKVKLAFLL